MTEQTALAPARSKRALDLRSESPIGRLRDEIDRLFEDFPFGRNSRSLFAFPAMRDAAPAVELTEKPGGYQLSVEVPGIDAGDIHVELCDGVLSIAGEKREEHESKDGGYLLSERSYGSFSRSISLPADVDADSVAARMDKGVLRLDMKKDKNAAAKSREIAIA